ncbi:unnamed protein product [Cyclocybe aegerita]|uniref:DUF6699 domain-containing protein n=1 Tax=Cyclocybe aegerita TaxID=1973307 RepID=A0A8S0WD45_CYCAE|nr:unnamed protein product [Cyclocybe aegerita]
MSGTINDMTNAEVGEQKVMGVLYLSFIPGAPFFVPNYVPVSSNSPSRPSPRTPTRLREYWSVWGDPPAERRSRVRFAVDGEDPAHCDDTPPPPPPRRWPRSASPWARTNPLPGMPRTPAQTTSPWPLPTPMPQTPWVLTPQTPQTPWAPPASHTPMTQAVPEAPSAQGESPSSEQAPRRASTPVAAQLQQNPFANAAQDPFAPAPDPFAPPPFTFAPTPAVTWVPVTALVPVQPVFQWQFGTPASSVNPWASGQPTLVPTPGPFTPATLFPTRTELIPASQRNAKEVGLLDERLYNHTLEWDVRFSPGSARIRPALNCGTSLYADLSAQALDESITEIEISFYDVKLFPLYDLWRGITIRREDTYPAFTSKDILNGISVYFTAPLFDNEVAYLCPTARQRRQLEDQRRERERRWRPIPADGYIRADLLNGHTLFSKVFMTKVSNKTCHLVLSIR